MSFPTKSEREKCWASKDDFWKCLDENDGKSDVCVKFRALYESSCPPQWVKHFDRKREYLKFKDRIQNEGINTITLPTHLLDPDPDSTAATLANRVDVTDVEHSTDSSVNHPKREPSPNTRVFRKFQPPTFT